MLRTKAILASAAFAVTSFSAPAAFADQRYSGYHDDRGTISEYCRDRRGGNTTKGALLGGAIGAAAGAGAAGRGSRGGGALIGGALGAGIGALAGRSASSCDDRERALRNDPYYDARFRDDRFRDDRFRDDRFRDDRYRDYRDARYGDRRFDRCHVEDVVRYDGRGRSYVDRVQVCD